MGDTKSFQRHGALTSWWFQPLWKIWVKMGSSSPSFGVKFEKNIFELPPTFVFYSTIDIILSFPWGHFPSSEGCWRPPFVAVMDSWGHRDFRYILVDIPSRELTYPTLGKGKSCSKCHVGGICYSSSLEGRYTQIVPKIQCFNDFCSELLYSLQYIHLEHDITWPPVVWSILYRTEWFPCHGKWYHTSLISQVFHGFPVLTSFDCHALPGEQTSKTTKPKTVSKKNRK